MEYTGTVVRKPFAPASKSAHQAVYLSTAAGAYKLERDAGNPFNDPELSALVGKQITCSGTLIDYVLRIRDWKLAE